MERISQKPDDWGLRLAFPGRICSGYFNRMFSCTPKPHINERFLCASCFLDCALFWLSVHTEKRRLSDTMHLLLLMFRLCVQDVENDAIKSIPKSIKAKFVRTSTLLQLHPAPTAMHLVRPLLFSWRNRLRKTTHRTYSLLFRISATGMFLQLCFSSTVLRQFARILMRKSCSVCKCSVVSSF
jgi:hypothetical protein